MTAVMPPIPSAVGRSAPCPACAAPMADDQRYCLTCGERRGPTRVALPSRSAVAQTTATTTTLAPGVDPMPRPASSTPAWVAAVGVLLLAMGVGVLIGRAGEDDATRAAAPITVVQGGAPTGGVPATTTPVAFTGDWPAGEAGWTVALQQFPKASTTPEQVAAAKAAAVGKGAKDAGALDSDAYASLEAGNYVVYAGRFDSRKKATAALADLKDAFPDARVVQVSADAAEKASSPGSGDEEAAKAAGSEAVKELDNASPEEFQKKSKALPKEVGTEGTAPPKDNKPAGGGGDFEEIG